MKLNLKMIAIAAILCALFCGCSLFQKNTQSNELEQISDEVLKRHAGVDISITPIPMKK